MMGIGVAFFTEGVGAGPRRHMDILGLAMNDGAELRVHPSGRAVVSLSAQTQGQGHETTFAQIVAEELGISPNDIMVRHGDTDKTPYGLGTYGSRSTPVSGGAVAVVSRKVRDKARQFAALMLETRAEDLAWEKGRWFVRGDPERGATIESIAEYAYSATNLPEGLEGGLDANAVYDPPNLTYPFGAYIAVVDIDPGTGKVHMRRFIAVDDCGVRINPMVVEGQIHGGLVEGIGQALMEVISFDEQGNCLNASFMDYLLPTALECPEHGFELGETVTPCPHHPIGAKGVGESPCVGSPPCIANAVVDALYHAKGIKHMDIPCFPARVWAAMNGNAQPAAVRNDALARRAEELAAQGAAFATATVVRAQRPTSAHAGDVALITSDGNIEGFVGGICAEHSVRLFAWTAMKSGEPHAPAHPARRRKRSRASRTHNEDGAVTVLNSCLSGGAIEIFLEPTLPTPRVNIVGSKPIAAAIEQLGPEFDLDIARRRRQPGRRSARATSRSSSPPTARASSRRCAPAWRPSCPTSGSSRAPSAAPRSSRSCARPASPDEQLDAHRLSRPAWTSSAKTPPEVALSITRAAHRDAPRRRLLAAAALPELRAAPDASRSTRSAA